MAFVVLWPKSITTDFSPGTQNGQEYHTIGLQRHSNEEKEITHPRVDSPPSIHMRGLGLSHPSTIPFALAVLCYTQRQHKQNHNCCLLPTEVSRKDVQRFCLSKPRLTFNGHSINIYEKKCTVNPNQEHRISNPLLVMLLLPVCCDLELHSGASVCKPWNPGLSSTT